LIVFLLQEEKLKTRLGEDDNCEVAMCLLCLNHGSFESRPKDVRTKSRKMDSLPPCPQNVRTGSTPLSVRTHNKFLKILCILYQRVRTSAFEKHPHKPPPCPYWTNPLWLRMSFMDSLLLKITYGAPVLKFSQES